MQKKKCVNAHKLYLVVSHRKQATNLDTYIQDSINVTQIDPILYEFPTMKHGCLPELNHILH